MKFFLATAAVLPLVLAVPAPQMPTLTQPLTVDLPNPTAGPGPIVKLPEGSYQGETSGGVNSFRGSAYSDRSLLRNDADATVPTSPIRAASVSPEEIIRTLITDH